MSHCHHHDHGEVNYNFAFALGVALNIGYVLVEASFGFLVNSLALLADAGHNLSDVLGLLLAWGAHYLSGIKPSQRRTYGWRSSSILAAFLNALILLLAIGGLVWEALRRFADPQPIEGTTMIWVAGAGVAINTITAMLFFAGRKGDLNIKGAFLHMAADAGVSAGVVLAGIVIYFTHLAWIDPAITLAIALVIFWGTWGLLRDSANLALHAVPPGVDIQEVRSYLAELPGVRQVHDLHIWAMSTTETALTAHLIKPSLENDDQLLADACRELHDRFHIEHVTLQIERDINTLCRQLSDDSL